MRSEYLLLTLVVQIALSAPANPLGTIGIRSSIGWNSGILPVNRQKDSDYAPEFFRGENGRGRRNDIEHVFAWWDDNGGLQVLDWVQPPPVVTMVAYVPYPENSNWKAVASGQFDNVHIKVGQKIAASRSNVKTIIRLAWEFNGNDFYWKATNAADFINGWKRIVDKMRQGAGSKAGNIVFAWCVAGLNCINGNCYGNLYPGDNYVDVVTVDYYDAWHANLNDNLWTNNGLKTMNTMLNFAKSHNKPLGVDEWGVHHVVSNTDDGDDNPLFINYMFNWVRANKDWVAWEVYFQDDSPTNVDSSLFSATRNVNPRARAAYIQQMQNAACCSVGGAIAVKYAASGVAAYLGKPTTNELVCPDNLGRYNHFERGSIYWTQAAGAFVIGGYIKEKWASLGWETGILGYPSTDELATPDNVGRFNHFSKGGSIYWTSATAAHYIGGAIKAKWAELGWERSALGFPITDELATPDNSGRYNHFQGGSIYWTARNNIGAHEVRGAIKVVWGQLGWENGLGYPISDEFAVAEGRRSNFERGALIWTAATGQVRRV